MSNFLLDTNILIYYFKGNLIVQPIFSDIRGSNAQGMYCPLTWIELLCYAPLTDNEANQIRGFLRRLTCVVLTETVLECAAQIRRDYRLKLPEALIAACAITQERTLVTHNVKDFERIEELTLLNPFAA